MLFDFTLNDKEQIATLCIKPQDLNTEQNLNDFFALFAIICADFYLDPELEKEEFSQILESAREKEHNIFIEISEDGIELEIKE